MLNRISCATLLGTVLWLTSALQSAHGQCQAQKIEPLNPAFFHSFGHAIAADSKRMAIGAHAGNEVVMYEFDGALWNKVFNYQSNPAEVGDSVGVFDRWMASGGCGNWVGGIQYAGSVMVFEQDAAGWHWSQELVANDPAYNDLFGVALVCRDGNLLVGAPYADGPAGETDVGAVYVFALDSTGSNWVQKQKLVPSHLEQDRAFGMALAAIQDTLVVGAPGRRSDQSGMAFVFSKMTSVWTETQVLASPSGEPENGFGDEMSVGISGDTILVGAWGEGPFSSGAAFVFRRKIATWEYSQKLIPSDPEGRLRFGNSVAIEGSEAVIGAWGDSVQGGYTGAAYHCELRDSGWVQAGKVLANDPVPDDALGSGLAISANMVLVGAQGVATPASPLAGAVYSFDLGLDAFQYCSCPLGGPCSNTDDHGGCANSSGQGAVLQACGSGSVTADDLQMESRWMPPNVSGIVMMGPRPDEMPYGDGLLCVGPGDKGLFRYPAGNSGAEGVITLGPGIVAYSHANFPTAGHIQPGDTWYFQAWYRDPNGPCGSGFNLSNGLKVEFTQ